MTSFRNRENIFAECHQIPSACGGLLPFKFTGTQTPTEGRGWRPGLWRYSLLQNLSEQSDCRCLIIAMV